MPIGIFVRARTRACRLVLHACWCRTHGRLRGRQRGCSERRCCCHWLRSSPGPRTHCGTLTGGSAGGIHCVLRGEAFNRVRCSAAHACGPLLVMRCCRCTERRCHGFHLVDFLGLHSGRCIPGILNGYEAPARCGDLAGLGLPGGARPTAGRRSHGLMPGVRRLAIAGLGATVTAAHRVPVARVGLSVALFAADCPCERDKVDAHCPNGRHHVCCRGRVPALPLALTRPAGPGPGGVRGCVSSGTPCPAWASNCPEVGD